MRTRRHAFGGVLVASLLVFAAVGASAGHARIDKGAGLQAAPSGTVTLSGWSVGTSEEAEFKKVLRAFNQAYPRIRVNYDALPNYDQAMLAKFSARKPPDVFYLNSEKAPTWIALGLIQPLDSYVAKSKFKTSPFFSRLLNAFRYKGKIYGFPKDWSPLGMEVNTAMLARAGVSAPTTWAQLRSAAQRLRSRNAVPDGRPICLASEWQRMLAFVYQNKGSVVSGKRATFTSPAVRQAAEFYVGLITSGLAGTPAQLGAGWCGEALGKEKAAIAFEGNWVYPYLPDTFPNLKWRFHPMVKGKQAATLAFTVAFSMGTHSKNKAAGWILLKFLTGRLGMRIWTSKGLALPARSDVKVSFPAPSRAPLLASAATARPWVWPPGFDRVWTIANNELGAVVEGKQTIPGMLSKINDEAARTLRRGR